MYDAYVVPFLRDRVPCYVDINELHIQYVVITYILLGGRYLRISYSTCLVQFQVFLLL
jgi:hypothetical protein